MAISAIGATSLPQTSAPRPGTAQTPSAPTQATTKEAFWLWTGIEGKPGDRVRFRQRLRLSQKPTLAKLVAESRGPFAVYVNGLLTKRYPAGAQTLFVTKYLDKGPGVLAFEVEGGKDASGLRFEMTVNYPDNRTVLVYSDGDEAISREAPIGWQTTAFDDKAWPRATVIPAPAQPPISRNNPNQPPRRDNPPPVQPLPAGRPDTTRLVRLWDIRGGRRPGEDPYIGPRNAGERMLLSCGITGDDDLPLLATTGFTLLETGSDALSTPETAPGVWELSIPDTDRARARRAAFDWSYFPHFAFPPEWKRRQGGFTQIECLEHEQPVPVYSPWDPDFIRYVDDGYSALQKAFSSSGGLSAVDLGIHGDYGEAGLFSGARMDVPKLKTDWTLRFGEPHDHLGWWCADRDARNAFRSAMIDRYGSVDAMNRAWKTTFQSSNEIAYPTSPITGSRRYWLDFVHWYQESITHMAEGIGETARRHLGNRLLMLPLGFKDEDPRGGNDNTGLIKMASRLGLDIRSSHGGFRPFADNQATMMGRISSAARFYGVPLWNEATSTLTPEEETARVFSAISLGAKGMFDWPENVKDARDVYYRYGKNLRVERPLVDVAMFFPSTNHLLRQESYPQTFARGCGDIRDVLNYDIVDEQMTLDGALSKYRILVLWEGVVIEAPVLAKIRDWVDAGGVLVSYDFGKIETPEGYRTWFADVFGYAGKLRLLPNPVAGEALDKIDLDRLRTEWAKPLGRGWTVFYPARKTRLRGYYEVIRYLTYHLSELDRTKRDALAVDDQWDGVYATLLTDKVIYFNPTKVAMNRTISLPAAAVAAQPDMRVRPAFTSFNVNVEVGGIAVLPFEPAPVEMLYQCEAFRTLNGLQPAASADFHPGQGATHVLIPSGKEISTRIRIDAPGSYSVFYRAIRGGSLARAEVLLDGKLLAGAARAPSAWGQTFSAGTVKMTAGVHTLTVRPPAKQAIRADFVILSGDPAVAGYSFAEKER